jgi:hypothetical protein
MEAALLARLRANPGVAAVAGSIPIGQGARPAIDWLERKSDEFSAFPACVLQVISAVGEYDQDGRGQLEQKRVRLEVHALDYASARALFAALRDAIEPAADLGGVRFHQAKLTLERDMPPEDLGGGTTIFRTVGDFMVPATRGD